MKCPNCKEKIKMNQNICRNCKIHLKENLGVDGGIYGEDFRQTDIPFLIKYFLRNAFKFLGLMIIIVLVVYFIMKRLTGS